MTTEEEPTPDGESDIELEPLATRAAAARHVECSDASTTHAPGDVGSPVPARPLHECLKCKYILTGLTSRRCPECGEPFALSTARGLRSLRSPGAQEDLHAVPTDRLPLLAGIALQLAGVLVSIIVLTGVGSVGQLMFVALGLSILTIACLVKSYSAIPWATAMLAAGLVSASVATMLLLLLA